MNKQQLFSTLVGTVLTLGAITVASADDPPWRYDADADRTFYSFSGPEIHNSGVVDNHGKPQARNLPWRYDADTDRTFYSFSGPEIRNSDVTDNADPKAPTLSWYYDADSDRIFYTFGGSDIRDSK